MAPHGRSAQWRLLAASPSGDSQGQTAGAHVFRDRSCQGPPHGRWDGVLHSSRTVSKGPGVTEAIWMNPHAAPWLSGPATPSPPVHRSHRTGCSLVGIPSSRPLRTPFQRTIHLPAPATSAFHSHPHRHVLETDSTANGSRIRSPLSPLRRHGLHIRSPQSRALL